MFLYLKGDDSHLNKTLDRAEGKAQSWAGKVGGFLGNAASFAVGGLFERGITGIVDGLAGGISAGLGFNNSMEQVTAQLNAFTKDGEKSAEILEMIRERAAKTPFEFEQMATATAALLPSAKQSGAALEDLIGQAEILAASNPAQGLEGAAFALKEAVSGDFTSIIERFNLPRKFINDLKEQGVPALEIVQKAMQELGLDADLVGNMAETTQGRWSTFKDTLTGLAATVMQPIFDTFSSKLGEINTYLAANEPLITAFAQQLAGAVQQAISWIINTGLPGLQQFANWFGSTAWPIIQPFLVLIGTSLVQAFQFLFNNINVILPILATLSGIILAITSPVSILVAAILALGLAWSNNWLGIQGVVSSAMAAIQPYLDQLSALLNAFITAILPPLQMAWQTLVQVWTGEVQPALAELWAALGELFTALGFGTGQTDVWSIAMGALKLILLGVIGVVQILTPAIRLGADVMTFMINQVKTAIDNFIAFKQGIDGVIATIRGLIDKVKELAGSLISLEIPDWLTPGSPTPFEMGLRGIAGAIDNLPELNIGANLAGANPVAAAAGGGGQSPLWTGNLIINGAGEPAAVGQAVRKEIETLFGQARR